MKKIYLAVAIIFVLNNITLAQCVTANAGPDKTICPGSTTSIGLNTSNNSFTYSWSPTTGLSSPNSAVTNASPSATTTYSLLIKPKNLIVNGNFEQGNTGFGSDYIYNNPAIYGTYFITTNPFSIHGSWCNYAGSTNKIMAVDGATNNGGLRVWFETISVLPNTT